LTKIVVVVNNIANNAPSRNRGARCQLSEPGEIRHHSSSGRI
jgi:hypothetical protein